jgi:hypothetical protein
MNALTIRSMTGINPNRTPFSTTNLITPSAARLKA